MKRILTISLKASAILLLTVVLVITLSEFSPIYNFEKPSAFKGPDIFNPYSQLDTTIGWKRSNFHTHTRVDNILNECPEYPDVVYEDYRKLGYDILTFSNHNQLTPHPFDSTLQVNVYEHGINLFKFHMLVFNPGRMILHDPLLPLLTSQKQFEYDYLSHNADFIFMNHPDRTTHTTTRSMQLLTGYRMMEADSGRSTELAHWDEALSAGHYSYCVTDDDNHDSRNSRKTAVRCTWLNSPSARYEDIRNTLLGGCFYSMRIPDFGDGDWSVKYEENSRLPRVDDIGTRGDTLYLKVSEPALWIKLTGQDHATLDSLSNTCSLSYVLNADEPYARFTACFDNGVYIYSNAFARYDKNVAPTPYRESEHTVNWLLTILFNLGLLGLVVAIVNSCRRIWRHGA